MSFSKYFHFYILCSSLMAFYLKYTISVDAYFTGSHGCRENSEAPGQNRQISPPTGKANRIYSVYKLTLKNFYWFTL